MAELIAAETTADPCCAPEQQASCCEPSAKASCCGHEEGCGCAAGSQPRPSAQTHFAALALAGRSLALSLWESPLTTGLSHARAKRFAILDHDLSEEAGELTPTLKVKRDVVARRYAAQFDALFEKEQCLGSAHRPQAHKECSGD